MEHAEVMRLLAVVPAGLERRRDRLVDVAQHRGRAGGQVVVEQHHARIEVGKPDPPSVANNRLEGEDAAGGELERCRRGDAGRERANAHAHSGLRKDIAQRLDVLQVERIARVILGHQQHAARIGTHALDGRLDRLHAQRQESGIQIVEPAGKKIGVDRRELEAGIAQVDRRIERHRMLLPVRAEPALDVRHPVEKALLQILQRSCQCGREMGDHETPACRRRHRL